MWYVLLVRGMSVACVTFVCGVCVKKQADLVLYSFQIQFSFFFRCFEHLFQIFCQGVSKNGVSMPVIVHKFSFHLFIL